MKEWCGGLGEKSAVLPTNNVHVAHKEGTTEELPRCNQMQVFFFAVHVLQPFLDKHNYQESQSTSEAKRKKKTDPLQEDFTVAMTTGPCRRRPWARDEADELVAPLLVVVVVLVVDLPHDLLQQVLQRDDLWPGRTRPPRDG